MTKREAANRRRCIVALQKHWHAAPRTMGGNAGELLYGLLDAAFGKLKPGQADAGRANAVRWLRRRAAR